MQRQKLLHVSKNFGDFLRVFGDAAQLFLIKVRRYLLAQQYLTDDAAQIRRTGAVIWRMYVISCKMRMELLQFQVVCTNHSIRTCPSAPPESGDDSWKVHAAAAAPDRTAAVDWDCFQRSSVALSAPPLPPGWPDQWHPTAAALHCRWSYWRRSTSLARSDWWLCCHRRWWRQTVDRCVVERFHWIPLRLRTDLQCWWWRKYVYFMHWSALYVFYYSINKFKYFSKSNTYNRILRLFPVANVLSFSLSHFPRWWTIKSCVLIRHAYALCRIYGNIH